MWQRRTRVRDGVPEPGGSELKPAALIEMADRYRDAGKPQDAAEAYGQVLSVAPWLTGVRVQYGNMLKDCGRLPEAEVAYRQALTESPDDADIHLQLGHVLKLMGRRPASQAAYRRAAELDPLSVPVLRELQEAGDPAALGRIFSTQLRAGGVEALLTLASELAEMRRRLDRLAAVLPDLRDAAAFPVACYDRFRGLFDVPAPAAGSDDASFLVILAADREPPATLYAQLTALRAQSYLNWRAIVFGQDINHRNAVERAAAADARFAWAETEPAEPQAEAEIRLAETVDADWLLLGAPGTILHPHALGWIAFARVLGDAPAFIFDSETGCSDGRCILRSDPVLRQVVQYDTLLETNICGETIAMRRDVFLEQVGRLCTSSAAAARHSVLLETCLRQRVGHIPFPLAWSAAAPVTSAANAQRAAVTRHVQENRVADRVEIVTNSSETLRIRWRPRVPDTTIAVIIPTRDNATDVQKFTDSLLSMASRPDCLSIFVLDNGGGPPARRALGRLERPGLQVSRVDEPFNWSRLNNLGARQTDAPLLVFANDDMRMLTREWDTMLRGLLERSDVGAVGARLLYPDDTIQHAGVLLGWRGSVIHDGLYEAATEPGPSRRWHLTRAVGAVTGAFLATRRQTFLDLGGFDEAELPIAYSDIDYALKLRASGSIVLWTPNITLYHYESKTRGLDHADTAKQARNAAELQVMQHRWGSALTTDPSVHPLWLDATMPFRLISAASAARINDHIRRCAASNPWHVTQKFRLPNAGVRSRLRSNNS
jgi:GT2 family glycosyltransferase/tetratricopeptide (TPR) repeat protein